MLLENIAKFIRIMKFNMTTKQKALKEMRKAKVKYRLIKKELNKQSCIKVRVPTSIVITKHMSYWSFDDIMAHNILVCDYVENIIRHLVDGEELAKRKKTDMKKSFLPKKSSQEDFDIFVKKLEAYTEWISKTNLDTETKAKHQKYGMLNAHQWNCLYSIYVGLHVEHAKQIKEGII